MQHLSFFKCPFANDTFQNVLEWFPPEIKANIMPYIVQKNAIIDWLTLDLKLINWKHNNWLQKLQLRFYNPCHPAHKMQHNRLYSLFSYSHNIFILQRVIFQYEAYQIFYVLFCFHTTCFTLDHIRDPLPLLHKK